jgi:hypothetical protein
VETSGDPEVFFRSLVSSRLDEPVLSYVSSLLVEFMRISPSGEPLCLKLGDSSLRRVLVLKEIGDESLFVSGFLRGPEPRYYAQIGATAYEELSERIRDPLFRILARNFRHVQEALREARRECLCQGMDHRSLLTEWVQNRSAQAYRMLESIVPRLLS